MIHPLVNRDGAFVGFYQPSSQTAQTYGVVELTPDYRGIADDVIASWFDDPMIHRNRPNNGAPSLALMRFTLCMERYLKREGHGAGWGEPITIPNPEEYGVYYTMAEVQAILRVSERTIYNWMRKGRLSSVRVGGGKHLFIKSEIDRLAR